MSTFMLDLSTMIDYVRYSTIRVYITCPLQYKKRFILEERPHYHEAVHRGSRIHKAVELWIKGDHSSCDKDLRTEEEKEYFAKTRDLLERVPTHDLIDEKIRSEVEFEICLEGIGNTHGKFDIVLETPDSVRIIDIKTGWNVGKNGILQKTLYLRAAEEIWQEMECSFAFWLPRKQEIYEPKELMDWSYIIQVVKEMKEDTEFIPKPMYKSCSQCPYGDTCTARRRKHGKGFKKDW